MLDKKVSYTHKLTLQLPDSVSNPLVKKAQRAGLTPEEVAADYVATAVTPSKEDPLLQLLGSIAANVNDISQRHDEYIGNGLREESRDIG